MVEAAGTPKQRRVAQRHERIVAAARDLAEAHGWDAVTTRRLADTIEYSQPVLYSHFKGKDAIMAAVAVEGCAELAAELRTARTAVTGVLEPLAAIGNETSARQSVHAITKMFNGLLPGSLTSRSSPLLG